MPQAGIVPPRQSHATYEASAALPPSHYGWIIFRDKISKTAKRKKRVIQKSAYQHSKERKSVLKGTQGTI